MLKVIISKEIRDLLGSTKFAIIFGVCAILIIATFYVAGARYEVNRSYHEASVAENLRRYEGVTDWFDVQDSRIILPPSPLASLVAGVSNDIGRSIQVSGVGELVAQGSRYNEDPLFAIFRFLDLEFVFGVILSLLAILLCYNSISGEKEQGTLQLTFAQPISRSTYILGKLLGSFIALAASIMIAVAIGSLVFVLMGIPMSDDQWLRLLLIIAIGLLYFGAFMGLSVFISAMTSRSANSLLLLLVVWICAVLIVPRVSVLAAGRAVDVPSVDAIASQKATFRTQSRQEFMDAMTSFDQDDHEGPVDQALMSFMDSLNKARELRSAEFAGRLNEDRMNRQEVQNRLALAFARVSPTASMSLSMSTLAGTNVGMSHDFMRQALDYQKEFADFSQEKTGVVAAGFRIVHRTETEGEDPPEPEPVDLTQIPVFKHNDVATAAVIGDAVPDIGLLVLYNLLFFAGAFVAFLKYDLR